MIALLTRLRVSLGFVLAVVVLWFAEPTPMSLAIGAVVCAVGESVRIWAAGHLEKSREVTQSGPYQYTRHPLYLGSSIMGLGIAIVSDNMIVYQAIVIYLALFLFAAMRSEEAHLREKFGDAYDAYAQHRAPRVERAFSWQRAIHNREHHAIAGLIAGLFSLAAKIHF